MITVTGRISVSVNLGGDSGGILLEAKWKTNIMSLILSFPLIFCGRLYYGCVHDPESILTKVTAIYTEEKKSEEGYFTVREQQGPPLVSN